MPSIADRNITIPRTEIAEFCERNDIARLSLFGSVLRDEFGPDSDVYILVEFLPGKAPGLAFYGMEQELEELFCRDVDFRTLGDLGHRVQNRVLREAEEIYVRK